MKTNPNNDKFFSYELSGHRSLNFKGVTAKKKKGSS